MSNKKCGDINAGKTCFLQRYVNNIFTIGFSCTIGLDFLVKQINKEFKLQIWDISSSERYRPYPQYYYRGSKAIVYFYDISNRFSFDTIQRLLNHQDLIQFRQSNNTVFALVGTKQDLQEERQISFKEGQDFANSLGLLFYETSAKTSYNVNIFYETLIDQILEKI